MIALVVRKEILAVLRDGKFLVLFVSALMILLGMWLVALANHESSRAERAQVGEDVLTQWENQGVKSPHGAAHFGIYVFPQPSVLAALDPGIGPHVGETIWVEPHKRNMARFTPATDAPVSARMATLSPVFVLHALIPLLLIGLAFNAVTQEREQGTLRMLHGLGLSGRHLLFGKLLGLLLVFTLAMAPALLLAVLAVFAVSAEITADLILRAGSLTLSFLLYYVVLLALALAISAWMRSSRMALLLLLGLWIGFVLVLPRMGSAVAERLVPLPTATAFWAAINQDVAQGMDDDGDSRARAARIEQEILEEYGVASIDELPVGFGALSRMARDEYADAVHERHFAALWQRYQQQENILRAAALLSPGISIRSLSMTMSATDLSHRMHFEESVEQYRRYFNRFIDEWDAQNLQVSQEAYEQLLRDVQPFVYNPPTAGFAWRQAASDLGILVVWLLAALGLLLRASRRLAP